MSSVILLLILIFVCYNRKFILFFDVSYNKIDYCIEQSIYVFTSLRRYFEVIGLIFDCLLLSLFFSYTLLFQIDFVAYNN